MDLFFPYIEVASHVFVVSVMCIFKKVNPRGRPSSAAGVAVCAVLYWCSVLEHSCPIVWLGRSNAQMACQVGRKACVRRRSHALHPGVLTHCALWMPYIVLRMKSDDANFNSHTHRGNVLKYW